jgi:hypothetical protein
MPVEIGARVGMLVVSEDLGNVTREKRDGSGTWRQRMWRAVCDCGEVVEILDSNFARQTSCGCKRFSAESRAAVSRKFKTHGHSSGGHLSPEYMTWQSMIGRCTRPDVDGYHRYGGRGITVCERWRVFANFAADMGDRPFGTTLDRINTDGDYEPGNCRWATLEEQQNNRCNNVRVEIDGVTKTATQWARFAGLSDACVYSRLKAGKSGRELLRPSNRKKVPA